MSDLFGSARAANAGPLADRMRPRVLDDILGQDRIVGPGRLLRRSIQADRLSSILLYGPPGTGKTSLARVVANSTRSHFESLNAVLAGVKDVREAIARAEERQKLYGRRTILFVDEVHRWNKAQQDALLPWVENGTVILIGATTENPFFEVNRALVSRSRIFRLVALTNEDLLETARRAIADRERGYGRWKVEFEEGALEHLVDMANGDARSLLNALELAVETVGESWPPPDGSEVRVSFAAAEESIQRKAVLYDRDGDYHFDTISAFIKSVRGSDADAVLYWLAKMVKAGEDPSFIFRRMMISAGEDVGLADPNAIVIVQACAAAFDRIGFPEGNFQLTQAALYLATAPKSNTALAFFDAMAEVEKEDAEVPDHLRDDHRDKEGFGHGDGYIYPHAYREHWAAQRYLPKALAGKTFYIPSTQGYEGRIRDEVLRKREIQAAVLLDELDEDTEILSWSSAASGREAWRRRVESGRSAVFLADRDAIFAAARVARDQRVLVAAADDGLLVWEASRAASEGLVAALACRNEAEETLTRYASTLDEIERPVFAMFGGRDTLPGQGDSEKLFGTPDFDRIIAREPFRGGTAAGNPVAAFGLFAARARELLAAGGVLVLIQSPPSQGERISRVLAEECGAETELAGRVAAAEEAFFAPGAAAAVVGGAGGDAGRARWTWTAEDLAAAFRAAGFSVEASMLERTEERLVTEREAAAWFDAGKSPWGAAVLASLGGPDFARAREVLERRAANGPLPWK
ncbi:MAG: recombinase RarA, partial [Treponema sp. GWB1_62_6]